MLHNTLAEFVLHLIDKNVIQIICWQIDNIESIGFLNIFSPLEKVNIKSKWNLEFFSKEG